MRINLKLLRWMPRILIGISILFISVFALDALDASLGLGAQALALLIHLIPSLILIFVLVLAWRWELLGGIAFAVIGLAFSPILFWFNYQNNHSVWISFLVVLLIPFPIMVSGALFMWSYFKRKAIRN